MKFPPLEDCTIAVVGLGYVGLPLAVEIASRTFSASTNVNLSRRVVGFDINKKRITELESFIDLTNEVSSDELKQATSLQFTSDPLDLTAADVFIITVPTPIDLSKKPDLSPLINSTKTIASVLPNRVNRDSTYPIVIYESTVYPGVTEEVCVPILESQTSFILNKDFFCGYSPERINPGDKEHRLTQIIKVTSGSDRLSSDWIDAFYASIIEAGTHQAPTIQVAEAAKVIENTQRDLNIALINELAIIFSHLNIDTLDVLAAASTKWNFLQFQPGLVGGHCIGVDPFYLTYKAEQVGYHPQVVLAGRRINDGMGAWIADQVVLQLAKTGQIILNARILVLGFSFKENCSDLRNTKVLDLVNRLKIYGAEPIVVDPFVSPKQIYEQYSIVASPNIDYSKTYSAVIIAVAHSQFCSLELHDWKLLKSSNTTIYDLKGIVPREIGAIRI